MPWLRGLDRGEERLRVVIDWRDPAVARVFKLMVPVTLGLGLINVNAVIDTFFASRFIDADLAPTAIQKAFLVYMLPQGMFSVAIATVLFPTLSRLASRGDLARLPRHGLGRAAPDRVPARPGRGRQRRARRADHPHPLPARRAGTRARRRSSPAALAAFSAGLVFNGAMLMLNRAFFSLQSNWIPTVVALGEPLPERAPRPRFYRFGTWGIPLATAVVQHRRHGRARRAPAPPRSAGSTARAIAATRSRRSSSPRRSSRVVAYGVWRPLDSALGRSFPAQVVSLGLGARRVGRGVSRRPVARFGCASCRRYSPCAAAPSRG